MKNNQRMKGLEKSLLTLASVLLAIFVWQTLAVLYDKPFILPTPLKVFGRLGELLLTNTFWLSVGNSLLKISLGTLLGVFCGFAAGVISALSTTARGLLSPPFSMVRATPVACFIILAWVIIGSKDLPIFISALMVAPLMLTGTLKGLESADPALLEVAKVYLMSPWQKVRLCYLPALAPHFSTAMLNSIGLAWKAGIAAEIIVKTNNSIGYAIWDAKDWSSDTPALYAWTLVVMAISLVCEWGFRFASAKIRGGEK